MTNKDKEKVGANPRIEKMLKDSGYASLEEAMNDALQKFLRTKDEKDGDNGGDSE